MAMMIVGNYGIYRGFSREYPPGRSDHEEQYAIPAAAPTGLVVVQARCAQIRQPDEGDRPSVQCE
jgi:hypothetical protein